MKPCLDRMEHTSLPERIRSLPKCHLNLSYENLAVKTLVKLLGRCCFKKEFQRFSKIVSSFLNATALTRDI